MMVCEGCEKFWAKFKWNDGWSLCFLLGNISEWGQFLFVELKIYVLKFLDVFEFKRIYKNVLNDSS